MVDTISKFQVERLVSCFGSKQGKISAQTTNTQ